MKTSEWFESKLPDLKRPVSASGMVTGMRCPRLFLYRNKWGIIPKVQPYSGSAKLGKIIHRLLQKGQERKEEVHQEIIKEHVVLTERIKNGEDITGDLERAANELSDTYQKAIAVVSIFWEKFPPREYMKTVCREQPIEAVYVQGNDTRIMNGLPLVGIMDWVVLDERDGSYWIRDTKSTSRSFESITTGFKFSIPCRFYRILAEIGIEWGHKVKGFILDMLATPSIRMCGTDEKAAAKLGCTVLEAYIGRVKEWYEKEGEKSITSVGIAFAEPTYNREIVMAFALLQRLWEMPPNPECFARDQTKSMCYAYERMCPYYGLCSSDSSTWPAQIEQFYQVREDKPMDNTDERKEE